MERIKPYIAEFIGTFALIFIGIGAIHNAQGNLLLIAFAHGLAIAVFVSAAMHISGGHLNPAVTLGILLGRQITFPQALAYWGAQLLGGFTAGLVALCIFGSKVVIDSTPQLTPAISPLTGVLIEAILTFFLVFVVFGTGVDERGRKIGGLAIGLTIVIGILSPAPSPVVASTPHESLARP